jgi:hypothetical protein
MTPVTKTWPWLVVLALIFFGLYLFQTDKSSNGPGNGAHPESTKRDAPLKRPNYPSNVLTMPVYSPVSNLPLQVPEFRLSGRISSGDGEPLPGATVSLFESKPLARTSDRATPLDVQYCDSEGKYIFMLGGPKPNLYAVIKKAGYVPLESTLAVRDPGETVKNYKLLLGVACVQGSILDENANPIAGALIRISPATSNGGLGNVAHLAPDGGSTDSNGKFLVRNLPTGRVWILASANLFVQRARYMTLEKKECANVDLYLPRARIISLTVKNRRGAIIPNVVALIDGPIDFGTGISQLERESEFGPLTWMAPLDSRPIALILHAKGYKDKHVTLDPSSPSSVAVLEDTDFFSGRVLSESGMPISGAHVWIWGSGSADTGSDGSFNLSVVDPPVKRIAITKSGYIERRLAFTDKPAWPGMDIQLQAAGPGVYGTISDESGDRVRRFEMYFQPPSDPTPFIRRFDGEDGSFSVTDIPPGRYSVHVKAPESTSPILIIQELDIRSGLIYGPLDIVVSRLATTKR